MTEILVTKRNGKTEPFNPAKVHKVINWALEDLTGVNLCDIEMAARTTFTSGIKTADIQASIIKAAGDLISEHSPDYQWVASRLLNWSLRDEVWGGQRSVPTLRQIVERNIAAGRYDELMLDHDLEILDGYINHNRDYLHTYAGMLWLTEKYLVQDRQSKAIFETPQFAYMGIAMGMFQHEHDRNQKIKEFYDFLSEHCISNPTPVLCGVRTPLRQFASCTLIDVGDSLKSIASSATALMYYASQRAGIGLNVGRIRPIGSKVGHGEIVHTGLIPYLKVFQESLKCTTQNGVRSASATVYFPFWHTEVETLLILKNATKNPADRMVTKLDYCIQTSRLLYERYQQGGMITLFSPHEAKGLYDAFGTPGFDDLYRKYEADTTLKFRKQITAESIMNICANERVDTGKVYVMHIDHANSHSSFDVPVMMSNLCLSGDTRLLTENGYRTMLDLWLAQGCAEIGDVQEPDMKFLVNEIGLRPSTRVTRTAIGAPLYRVTLQGGLSLKSTANHEFELWDGGRAQLKDLAPGVRLRISDVEQFGTRNDPEYAELAGHVIGDGSISARNATSQIAYVRLWNGEIEELGPIYQKLLQDDYSPNGGSEETPNYEFIPEFVPEFNYYKASVTSCSLGRKLMNDGLVPGSKHQIPASVWFGDRETVAAFLRGFFTADGMIGCYGSSAYVSAGQASLPLLQGIQILLSQFGIKSSIHPHNPGGMLARNDGKGGIKEYEHRSTHRLVFSSRDNMAIFCQEIGVRQSGKMNSLKEWLETHPGSNNSHNLYYREIESIEPCGIEDTFCLTEPEHHQIIVNGFVTGQCTEVIHPTTPIQHIDDPNGEIGICMLSAINVLTTKRESIPRVCRIIVRYLDNLIEHQEYPVAAGANFCKKWRSLAIGITNLAAWIARQGLRYDDEETPNVVSDLIEEIQYWLLDASCDLAAERGPCFHYQKTKYSKGLLPIDHYWKGVDRVVTTLPKMPWEELRQKIAIHGLRNSTLTAQMPCESSSVVQNSTNGIETPRANMSFKKSKSGMVRVILPGFDKGWKYDFIFSRPGNNRGQIKIVAAMQKWMDMSISTNIYYAYDQYPDNMLPLSDVIQDQLLAYSLGLKTIYYTITDDGDKQSLSPGSLAELNSATTDGVPPSGDETPMSECDTTACESGACAI